MNSSPTPAAGAEQASPPHGWYPDPVGGDRLRFWDGTTWTPEVRSADAPATPDRGLIDFVAPGSPAVPAPVSDVPQQAAARTTYGTPVDFRGRRLARPEVSRPPVDNPKGASGGVTADGVPLAPWGQRVVATLADWLVNVVVVALLLTLTVTDFWGRYSRESTDFADRVLAGQADLLDLTPELIHLGTLMTAAAGGVSVAYGVVLLGLFGATLGQRLLRLRVVPFGRGKARLGWLQAVVRTLVWTLLAQGGSFIVLIQLVSVLLPLWHPHKQTLHDMIARTQVVKDDVAPRRDQQAARQGRNG